MNKNFVFLVCLAFGCTVATTVFSFTLDSKVEQISIDVAKQQNEYRDKTGYKQYLEIPETKVVGGVYRVDQYETPCKDGLNPPICYGYQIIFEGDDKEMLSTGEGLMASRFTAETSKISPVASTTPKL